MTTIHKLLTILILIVPVACTQPASSPVDALVLVDATAPDAALPLPVAIIVDPASYVVSGAPPRIIISADSVEFAWTCVRGKSLCPGQIAYDIPSCNILSVINDIAVTNTYVEWEIMSGRLLYTPRQCLEESDSCGFTIYSQSLRAICPTGQKSTLRFGSQLRRHH